MTPEVLVQPFWHAPPPPRRSDPKKGGHFFNIFEPPPHPPPSKAPKRGFQLGGGLRGAEPKSHWGMQLLDKILILP